MTNTDTSFDASTEPKDKHLIKLLEHAYRDDIKCCRAVVKFDLIKPFSNFKPEITKEYRASFLKGYLNLRPPELYVYQKDSKFIMSDDYTAYYMYNEVKAETAVCVIIGDFKLIDGITAGPKYSL